MRSIAVFLTMTFATGAMAYQTGTYNCKNGNPELPDSQYEISNTEVGGVTLPVVKATRYYADGDEIKTLEMKGLAAVSTYKDREILSINQFRLEFTQDELINCKQ